MRTWRLVSLLSILALVLAACGVAGKQPVGRGVGGPGTVRIGGSFGRASGRAGRGRHAGVRRRSPFGQP